MSRPEAENGRSEGRADAEAAGKAEVKPPVHKSDSLDQQAKIHGREEHLSNADVKAG